MNDLEIEQAMDLAIALADADQKANEGVYANSPYKIGQLKAHVRERHGETYLDLLQPEKALSTYTLVREHRNSKPK